jgi:carbamate kinase
MGRRVVIALGGNAIKQPDERGTAEEQARNVATACRQIAEIIRRGYEVVLTHGNGPQVGNLAIQQEQAKDLVPPQPLVILGAMTQGQIGYLFQQGLRNELSDPKRPIVTVVTQVLVDKDDPDFKDPHKPVGPFYDEEEARVLGEERGWVMKRVRPDIKGWRRVVPSPNPIAIIEGEAVRRMVDDGMIVIASGGGGIPVIERDGRLEGVDAVIDKDLAGEILAEEVGADTFLILTDVECVKLDYGKPSERPIYRMTVDEAKRYLSEGHFLPGSMGPKVEACIRFIEHGGERAIIASLKDGVEALEGRAGTHITR